MALLVSHHHILERLKQHHLLHPLFYRMTNHVYAYNMYIQHMNQILILILLSPLLFFLLHLTYIPNSLLTAAFYLYSFLYNTPFPMHTHIHSFSPSSHLFPSHHNTCIYLLPSHMRRRQVEEEARSGGGVGGSGGSGSGWTNETFSLCSSL